MFEEYRWKSFCHRVVVLEKVGIGKQNSLRILGWSKI